MFRGAAAGRAGTMVSDTLRHSGRIESGADLCSQRSVYSKSGADGYYQKVHRRNYRVFGFLLTKLFPKGI